MALPKRFSAAEKGKARQVGPDPPLPKRGRGRPRKLPATPTVAPRGRGGGLQYIDGRVAAVGGRAPAARPPRPRSRATEVLPEFVVWSAEPTSTRLPLPRFLLGELLAGAPGLMGVTGGLRGREPVPGPRLADVCPRAWPEPWCTLHFKFDGDATLYVRVFGEDGRRAGCCPEGDDRGWEPSSADDGEGSARAAGGAQDSSSFSGSSSGGDSSSGGRGQPPCRRICLGGGNVSAHPRAPVKRERESA